MLKHAGYLGLGSNLGSRRANLEQALARLQDADLRVQQVSSVYESEPVGPVPRQPLFLNAVARVQTSLGPRELLSRCLEVEDRMGRQRLVDKGPRSIDVDLLLVNDVVASWPELQLPHPELTRRAFVLLPLMEIAPLLTDPRDSTLLCCKVGTLLRTQSIMRVGRLSTFGGTHADGGHAKRALAI
jgi:2-amino-4-hydroxy-6-hydroxymethyldihydropteridine diphosphokinase